MPKQGEIDNSYPSTLLRDNKIQLLEPFSGAKAKHAMRCLVCEHEWVATPISKRQTFKKHGVSGCPQCNDARREAKYTAHRQEVIEQLNARGIRILDGTYDGRLRLDYSGPLRNEKILVENVHCGHQFYVTPLNLIQSSVECGTCGPTKRAEPLTKHSKARSVEWKRTASEWQQYKALVTALTEKNYTQHAKVINPQQHPRGRAGVEGAYHLDHVVPKRYCFDNNIPADVCAHPDNLQMLDWRDNVGSRNHIKGSVPAIMLQYVDAGDRIRQYADVLTEHLPGCKLFVQVQDVLVTAYQEASQFAVVVIPIDHNHANMKSATVAHKTLSSMGINFVILFEDELVNNALIQAKLRHLTHKSDVDRIHARQCIIRECDSREKGHFLLSNHVQGNDAAPIKYGAYYGDRLVAVMTFTPPRIVLGQKADGRPGRWELSRFCTDVTVRVPGIASRLLSHFKRHHEWTEIYSYADRRWSTGNLYSQLGFTCTSTTPPDYFYVVDGKRKHRWNFRKDVLKNKLSDFDPTATEYQNMVDHGYWRVWDCGSMKFTMHNATRHGCS